MAIPVPRVVPNAGAGAALVADGVVGWPWLPGPALPPPGSPPDTGCSLLTCVAVLKVCPGSHHPWDELIPSWGEARGLFSTFVHPKGRVTKSIWTLTKSISLVNTVRQLGSIHHCLSGEVRLQAQLSEYCVGSLSVLSGRRTSALLFLHQA